MSNHTMPLGIGIIFNIVTVIAIIFTLNLFVDNIEFTKNAEPVTGIINDIDITTQRTASNKIRTYHDVYVDFTYNNQEYNNIHIDQYSSLMKEGNKISLLVNTNDYSDVKAKNYMWFLPIGIALLSIMFALASISFDLTLYREKTEKIKLQKKIQRKIKKRQK